MRVATKDADMRKLDLQDRLQLDQICIRFEDSINSVADYRKLVAELMAGVEGDYFRACVLYEVLRIEFHRVGSDERATLRSQHSEDFPELKEIIDLAWAIQNPLDLTEGCSIAGYTIIRQVGRGGFGAVYLAEDADQNPVVVKLIAVDCSSDDAREIRGIDELNSLQRLRHSRIIPLLDFGVYAPPDAADDSRMFYLIMPYFRGGTLESELSRGQPTIDRSLAVAMQLADALSYAHGQGILHRDLKPSNLLLKDDGSVVVADFGLAQNTDLQQYWTSEISGSPKFMSPEQLRGENRWLDGRTDIWSVGVILYRMLTGCYPFNESSVNGLMDEISRHSPRPIRQLQPAVPISLEAACLRCLRPTPHERFATASELLEILTLAEEELRLQSGTRTVPSRTGTYSNQFVTRSLLLCLCLTLIYGLLTAFMAGGDTDSRNGGGLALVGSTAPATTALRSDSRNDQQRLHSLVQRYGSERLQVRSQTAELKNGELLTLKMGEDALNLKVSTSSEAYLYVFSVEPDGIKQLIPEFDLPILCEPFEWYQVGPYETELSKADEFLLFIATNLPLNCSQPSALLDDLLPDPTAIRRMRGIKVKPIPLKASVMYVPYRVGADVLKLPGQAHSATQ